MLLALPTAALPALPLSGVLSNAATAGMPWLFRSRNRLLQGAGFPGGTLVRLVRSERPSENVGVAICDQGFLLARVLSNAPCENVEALLFGRVREALQRRVAVLQPSETNAFRWLNGEGDGLPGVHVDLYGRVATVRYDNLAMRHFYSSWLERALRAALPDLHRVEDRDARAAAIQCEVLELGLRYNVNLAVGQKGGLFLDQRENRLRVREMARGRNVLNLFCYTGGFSLNAALGGAASVTSVDMSPAVIEAARENFRLNGLTGGEWRFVAADAYSFLEQAFQEKLRWDLVITDPPAFASSSTHVDNAIAAYTSLHRLALRITMPDSIVCFSSCSSRINSEIFLSTIHDAAAAVRRRIFIEGTHRAAFDHPPHPYLPTTDYLKFVVARVKPQPRLPHEAFLKK